MSDQAKPSNDPSGLVSGSEAPQDTSVGKPREWKVDGWLLVLCVWLVVLGPINALINTLFDPSTIESITSTSESVTSSRHKLFQVVFQQIAGGGLEWFPIVADLSVGAFGVWAGLCLWGVRKGAVPLTKTFLKVDLAASLARSIIIAIFLVDSTGKSLSSFAIPEMLIVDLTVDIPFFFIWNSYLNKSKRVRRTFGL